MKILRTWGIFFIILILILSNYHIITNINSEKRNFRIINYNEDLVFNEENNNFSNINSNPSTRSSIPRRSAGYNDDFHNIFTTKFNYTLMGANLYFQGPIYIGIKASSSFADIDNDGDQDLIVGEKLGILHYFENIGNSKNSIWMKNSNSFNNIDVGQDSTPTLRDLDNDNDLDLTIGAIDGTLYYYENIGNINTPNWNLNLNMFTGIDVGFRSKPAFGDLDNDNDFDLTIGAYDGTLYYYENTGTNQNPSWNLDVNMFSGIDVGDSSAPCFADFDADNDLDLIIGAMDGNIYYYNNTGNPTSPIWTLNNSMFSGIFIDILSNPAFADLDNDGDLDFILGVYEDGILYFYNNTGSPSSPIWTLDESIFSGIDVYSNNKPALADLDDDGDLDLTIGSYDGKLFYHKNIGDATSPKWELDSLMYSGISGGGHYSPAFADLDDDSDFDLTIGIQDGTLKYYNNTGTPQNPIWTLEPGMFASIDIGDFNTPVFSDLDNDGDYDLTMGEKYGTLFYYENIGNENIPIWNLNNSMFPGIDVTENCKPTFADLDEDEDLDLIIGNDNGECIYYENNGTKETPNWIYNPEIFSDIKITQYSAPFFTDIDNDLDIDLLIGGGDGGLLYFYENIRSINSNIELLNGDGFDNKTIYTKYQSYKFQIEVQDNKGYNDIEKIILILDPFDKNLSYCWSQNTKLFSELSDPHDYTKLSTGSYENDGDMNWTVVFNIIFNWSYSDEELHDVKVIARGQMALSNSIIIPDFYHVENDLDFVGNLTIVGEYQGNLSEGAWAKGNEKITWGDLKVVYENSFDIYPLDNEFNVTLSDTHGQFWNDTSSSGKNISIVSTNYNKTNLNELFKLNITGIPSYCDHSNISFPLKIDADNITFTNPMPSSENWHRSNIVNCTVTVNDIGGSNVSAESIEYSVSNNNGSDWSNWYSAGMTEDLQSIECSVNTEFEDGIDNLIRWRGKDAVGNGYTNSDSFGLLVDTTNVTFHNPLPDSSKIFVYTNVTCSISIEDKTSGVNANTIEYSILKDGEAEWPEWISVGKTLNNNLIECSITPAFNNGTENYIRWRAKDMAGNGYNESEIYKIKIDTSTPLPVVKLLYPPDGSNVTTTTPELRWELNYTGTDAVTYNVYLDTNEEPISLVSEGQTETNFIPTPLNDREIYYWKVMPIINEVSGQCISGIWSFTVNLSHTPSFGLELYAERNIITVEQGESSSMNITIKNIGENKDTFILNFDSPVFGNDNIELDQILIELYPDEIGIVQMQVNAPFDMIPSYYGCNINASSIGALDYGLQIFSNLDLIINVLESSVSYGVNLTLEKYKIEIEQGKSAKVKLFIKNIGTETDIFQLEVISIDFNITNINVANNISIDANNLRDVYLNISVPKNQPVTTYKIKISVMSFGALNKELNIEDTKMLNLVVLESESDETSEDLSFLLWLILIISIFIIILFVFIKRKKQKEKESIKKEQPPETPSEQEIPTQPQEPQIVQQEQKQQLQNSTPTLQSQVEQQPNIQKSTTEVIPVKSQSPVSTVKQPFVEDNSISEKEIEE